MRTTNDLSVSITCDSGLTSSLLAPPARRSSALLFSAIDGVPFINLFHSSTAALAVLSSQASTGFDSAFGAAGAPAGGGVGGVAGVGSCQASRLERSTASIAA